MKKISSTVRLLSALSAAVLSVAGATPAVAGSTGSPDQNQPASASVLNADDPSLGADVNGDGRADIVGFGEAATYVSLGRTNGTFAPSKRSPEANFSYALGWRVGVHLRLLGDVNGDKRADTVAFGNASTYVALGQSDGTFSLPKKFNEYSLAQGWTLSKHVRLLADVNGDGRADIVAFGNSATYVSMGQANGTFAGAKKSPGANFSYDQGWRVGVHLRLLGDVNGDKRSDIVAFGNTATYVALGQSNGTFADAKKFNEYSIAQGWTLGKHLRQLADVNGDSRTDIVAFGNTAAYVALGQANGNFATSKKSPGDFSYAQGWRVDKHIRFLADVNGDRRADIVGFGDKATYVANGQSNGTFSTAFKAVSQFSIAQGWTLDRNPRALGDMNGDNRADIVGISDRATHVATYDTQKKAFVVKPGGLSEFSLAQGWQVGRHVRILVG
ncbi:FG-GAP repeat domain-containing protein [Arthrobacter sp. NPDC056691]|uniref:FG-GAP repeat domain-containing protein n=1 Tax=Arthrobacter sp. NPDC056691 TaxID=3345913 RepID=UPI00367285DD